MNTPMVYSAINAISNIILAVILFPVYGVVGLGIATSAAGWINALLLLGSLIIRGEFRPDLTVFKNLAIIIIASVLMAGLLLYGQDWLGVSLTDIALIPRLGYVLGLIGAAAILYFAIVIASGAVPKDKINRLARRK